MKTNRAFTLIETMLVIVVIAAIILMGQQQYQSYRDSKHTEMLRPYVLQAKAALTQYYNGSCNCYAFNYIKDNIVTPSPAPVGGCADYVKGSTAYVANAPASAFSNVAAKLPYATNQAIAGQVSMPLLPRGATNTNTTLSLVIWVPNSYVTDDLLVSLGATLTTKYPNGSSPSQTGGQLLSWSWPAMVTVSSANVTADDASMAYFGLQNVPSYQSILNTYKNNMANKLSVPPDMPTLSCSLVPAWLTAAQQCYSSSKCS